MQQFVVPQFIDVEDKIFGPITTRQFLILLVAGLTIFAAYKWADFALFLTIMIFVGGSSLVIAFVKVRGQTFHYFILNVIQSFRKPSLRIWNKHYSKKELDYFRKIEKEEEIVTQEKKATSRKHIRDLSLVVNTGGYYRPEE